MNGFMFYMDAGGPVMWVILLMSVLGAAIVIERLAFFALASRRLPNFGELAPLGTALQDVAPDALQILAERTIRADVFEWRRRLPALALIIKAAPMLGLLGTVLGMVRMFGVLSQGGAIDAPAVTGGIREALFTTVAGLCCAVPLLVVQGFLSSKADAREEALEAAADEWLRKELLKGAGAGHR
ncbi:MAG: MotA/TolQ/ExbB proton channel family protein [Synergistaceae bacterium]|jgi:biopolymer transport protein ExbB|nr:MotA/TolQ/ExbB proton channel family protein [Synergistaceae bacterium]